MRREPCIAGADAFVSGRDSQALLHPALGFTSRLERRKAGIAHSNPLTLLAALPRKRRVHDHQIELAVTHAIDQVADIFGVAAAGGDR